MTRVCEWVKWSDNCKNQNVGCIKLKSWYTPLSKQHFTEIDWFISNVDTIVKDLVGGVHDPETKQTLTSNTEEYYFHLLY